MQHQHQQHGALSSFASQSFFFNPPRKPLFFSLSLSVFISTRKSALMMRDFNKVGVKKEGDFLQNDAGITKLLDSLKVYVNQVKNTRDSSNDKKRKLSNGSEMEVSQYNGLEINYTRDDNGGLKELKINQIVQLKQLINDRKFSKKNEGEKPNHYFPIKNTR